MGEHWQLHGSNIITGVPENDWHVDLPLGVCLDMVPIDTPLPNAYALRPYGMHDASWRSQFGGSIYKYNGSHGCVNMPRSKVSKLYKMVPNGTRVIIRK